MPLNYTENYSKKWLKMNNKHGYCRGTYYKPHVYTFIRNAAKSLDISFNAYVNRLLEHAITEGTAEAIGETLKLEKRRDLLLREESSLRQRLTVILRSGAHLQDYAEKLLLGGQEEISRIRNRTGVYAYVDSKELDVILRILQRREDLVKELITLEDKLLPQTRYPVAPSDKGWKIGRSRSRA